MATSARKHRRIRVASPLDIRKWILDEEDVYEGLCRRIEALEAVAEPLAKLFVRFGIALGTTTLDMLGRTKEVRILTEEEEGVLARASAANLVAAYWRQHEYRRGVRFPPIMIAGAPWDTLPDHIHVLDLSPEEILKAAPTKEIVAQLSRVRSPRDQSESLHLLLGVADGIIRQFGPWALVMNPVVVITLFHWLVLAKFAPTKAQAKYAASCADALLDALRPDLSRRVVRTPNHLANAPEDSEELLANARKLKVLQRQHAFPRAILSKAKKWFGARVDGRDLRRWGRMTAAQIVTDVLGGEKPKTKKTLRDYSRLADRAGYIAEAWQTFRTDLESRPPQDQRRITGALQPLVSPHNPRDPRSK